MSLVYVMEASTAVVLNHLYQRREHDLVSTVPVVVSSLGKRITAVPRYLPDQRVNGGC